MFAFELTCWTYPRSPKMNAHNERFNRTIQEQFIDYNTKISHHSLLIKTSAEYLLEKCPECHIL